MPSAASIHSLLRRIFVEAKRSDLPLKFVSLCRRRDGTRYAEITGEGSPGDMTSSFDIVLSRPMAETVWGPIVQLVAVPQGESLLATAGIVVLRTYGQTDRLEIVERLGDPSNAVLERVP